MKNSNYTGENILESRLFKKHIDKVQFQERIYKFSLKDKVLSYKLKKELNPKKIYTSKDLKSFKDSVNDNHKNTFFSFGFQIQTSKKIYVLFAEKYEDYINWVRVLKYFFYKIDILNQFSGLSLTNKFIDESNSNYQRSEHKSKRNERGIEYKYYAVPKSHIIINEPPKTQIINNEPPQSSIQINDNNQKVGIDYCERYLGDKLIIEYTENPVQIEKKKVISNVITNTQSIGQNNLKEIFQKKEENNEIHKKTSLILDVTNVKDNSIKKPENNINDLEMEIDKINDIATIKPLFLLDLKKSNKSTNINFLRSIIEKTAQKKENENMRVQSESLQKGKNPSFDNNILVSDQHLMDTETNDLNKSKSDHVHSKQINITTNKITNISNNLKMPLSKISEYDEKVEFVRKEISPDSGNDKKIDINDLEKAFINNTNKISFDNHMNVVKHKDSFANFVFNRVNNVNIHNIFNKKVISTNFNELNTDNEIKENCIISNNDNQNHLNDQKIFKISSDFEVGHKVKTKTFVKIPVSRSDDTEDNSNVGLNKNPESVINHMDTHNTYYNNNDKSYSEKKENKNFSENISKDECFNDNKSNKGVFIENSFQDNLLNESIRSKNPSNHVISKKSGEFLNENDKLKNNDKRYFVKTNHNSINDFTELYIKNSSKTIESKKIQASKINKIIQSLNDKELSNAWVNENTMNYQYKRMTFSADCKTKNNITVTSKEVRTNSYVKKDMNLNSKITEVKRHNLNLLNNNDNLHVYPDCNTDEFRIEKNKSENISIHKNMDSELIVVKGESNNNKINISKNLYEEMENNVINNKKIDLIEDHHLILNISHDNINDEKVVIINNTKVPIKLNQEAIKEQNVEKSFKKEL